MSNMNKDIKTTFLTSIFIALQYTITIFFIIGVTIKLNPPAEFIKNFLFYIGVFILPILLFIKIVFRVNPYVYLDLSFNLKAIATGFIISIIMFAIFYITHNFKLNVFIFDIQKTLLMTGMILAGIFEEIPFRGFYLKFFESKLSFPWSNFITALMFSSLHIRQIIEQGMIQFFMLFIMGLFLGYLYKSTKSLWAPIIIHMTYNTLIFLFK